LRVRVHIWNLKHGSKSFKSAPYPWRQIFYCTRFGQNKEGNVTTEDDRLKEIAMGAWWLIKKEEDKWITFWTPADRHGSNPE